MTVRVCVCVCVYVWCANATVVSVLWLLGVQCSDAFRVTHEWQAWVPWPTHSVGGSVRLIEAATVTCYH